MAQYRDLKSAVAGILYMRNKLEAEIQERRVEIARAHDDIRRGIQGGKDDVALALITHRQRMADELARAARELEGVKHEADEAKANLIRFREEIRSLERERGRALAVLASATARRRVSQAVEGLSVEAEVQALESVREHVAQLATEGSLDRELAGHSGELQTRIRILREEAQQDMARKELEERKRALRSEAIPPGLGEFEIQVTAADAG